MITTLQHRAPKHRAVGESGFSLIELLIVVAVILIIAAIAIPNFLKSRIAANEASAAENLRAISTASVVYNSTWGNGYPPSMDAMGGSGSTATCDAANLLDPVIATAPYIKTGYAFAYTGEEGTVTGAAGCGAPGYWGYLITATPESALTGTRAFCSDEPGEIHYNLTGTAPADQASCDALPPLQ
jgi:type IV pilus assembly protein PilA